MYNVCMMWYGVIWVWCGVWCGVVYDVCMMCGVVYDVCMVWCGV